MCIAEMALWTPWVYLGPWDDEIPWDAHGSKIMENPKAKDDLEIHQMDDNLGTPMT